MKIVLSAALAAALILVGSPASAYELRNGTGGRGCEGDGSACYVHCDNGELAGVMYWNGSVWTDGVKSSPSRDAEAQIICRAMGSECR